MPRPKLVKSLSQTSLQLVARQLAIYNVQEDMNSSSTHDEEPPVSKCLNPFDKWPSYLVQQVVGALEMAGLINLKHRDLLVTSQTTKLDLSLVSGILDTKTVVHLLEHVAVCCPQLTVLVMQYNGELSPVEYKNIFLHFKHLQVLDVSSGSLFDDSVLQILGIYCTDLRELDISHCFNVTDDGITGLCGGAYLGNDKLMVQRGQCKSLRKLSITYTQVTPKGIQIALENSPHLEVLSLHSNHHEIEILAHMHRNDLVLPQYALSKLSLSPDSNSPSYLPYKVGDLRLVASLCPFVTRVSIKFHDLHITDSDLLGLIVLERLSELHLEAGNGFDDKILITFDGGLAPLLKAIGSSLKSLDLKNLPISVCLYNILKFCANLERLMVYCCTYLAWMGRNGEEPSSRTETDLVWTNLKELSLTESKSDHQLKIPPEFLLLALSSSPALQKLVLKNCDSFDDDLLQTAFQFHSFKNLEELDLYFCNSVSSVGINLFMTEENPLNWMHFVHCDRVRKKDVENWNMEGKKYNWNFVARNS